MPALRPTAPIRQPQPAPDEFLYVEPNEVAEALALGARYIEGDARLVRPRPLPDGVDAKAFGRWQTTEARYRWSLRYIARVLGDLAPSPGLDELLGTIGAGQAAQERVYLYVPAYDAQRVREMGGVMWDKRRRMYYATAQADLNQLLPWLTPAARGIWESERALHRALTLLVQDRARAEAKRRGGGTGGSGGVVHERPLDAIGAEDEGLGGDILPFGRDDDNGRL